MTQALTLAQAQSQFNQARQASAFAYKLLKANPKNANVQALWEVTATAFINAEYALTLALDQVPVSADEKVALLEMFA